MLACNIMYFNFNKNSDIMCQQNVAQNHNRPLQTHATSCSVGGIQFGGHHSYPYRAFGYF